MTRAGIKQAVAVFLILTAAVAVAAGRVFITPRLAVPSSEGSYEAFAHLFVGFLVLVPFYDPKQLVGPSRILGGIGWFLAFWELGWFLFQKFHG
jgi:hypothetical protein